MTKRKSISKKLRFEIFKRDEFTCQYCGTTPPSVLEIDHINPVVKGGDNSEDNLITACFDCNRGKSATPLSEIPKSLKIKSGEIKEREAQILGYNKIMLGKIDRIKKDAWSVIEVLENDLDISSYGKSRIQSIKQFVKKLPLHEVIDAAEITSCRFSDIGDGEFSYFCGICWSKLREFEDA